MIEIVWALALAIYAILLWVGVEAVKSQHTAAGYLSFTAAAIILGIADIMWAATTEQSLGSRLFISAVVGAVVLVGLSESIRYVYRSQHLQPAKNEAQNRQKESKNSPTISASGNVTIGHIGDVYNSDTPQIDLTKNEGVLVPSNLPTPPMPRECNIPKDFIGGIFWIKCSCQ